MTDAALKVVARRVAMAIRAPAVQRLTVAAPAPVRLTVKPRTTVAIAVPRQGPPGPQGPPPDDLRFTATTALGGHRAVYVRPDGALAYASADLPESLDAFVGVTTGAAGAGAPVVVRAGGEMVEPSWSWTPGPVWLGLDGQLTQADPAEAVALLVGIAIAAIRLLIDPEPAFRPV